MPLSKLCWKIFITLAIKTFFIYIFHQTLHISLFANWKLSFINSSVSTLHIVKGWPRMLTRGEIKVVNLHDKNRFAPLQVFMAAQSGFYANMRGSWESQNYSFALLVISYDLILIYLFSFKFKIQVQRFIWLLIVQWSSWHLSGVFWSMKESWGIKSQGF